MRKTLVLACLIGGLLLQGCNAGLGVVLGVLLNDDDGGHKKKRDADKLATAEFIALENGRLRPSQSVIVISLRDSGELPAELRVEYAKADGSFQPAAIIAPPGGSVLRSAGLLRKLKTSTAGIVYRIPWNASSDLGGDAFQKVKLQFTGDIDGPIQVEVQIGNDAPVLSGLTVAQREGEDVAIGVLVADSSQDPVDVVVEFATEEDDSGARLFRPARSLHGQLAIPSTIEGEGHAIAWGAPSDAGPFDRVAVVKLTPFDRIGGEAGKTGAPIEHVFTLNNNHAPEVEILESDLLTDPDRRGNVSLRLQVRDAESNPVDAIVQWTTEGEAFPDLDPALETNPTGRQSILEEAEARRSLRIVDLASDPLEGPIELASSGEPLGAGDLLASWIKSQGELRGISGSGGGSSPLLGRIVSLTSGAVDPPQTRTICAYAADRGVLRLDSAFEPAPQAGARIRIELGGPHGSLRLTSSPDGVLHPLIWSSGVTLPGGGAIRFRVTPFDRVAADAAGCGASSGSDAPGIASGSRGLAPETGGAKPLRGPFSVEDSIAASLAPIDEPVTIAATDVDGDGRKDVVVAARSSNVVLILLQTAPGVFDTLRLSDSRIKDPSGLVAKDLDGDGDIDVAVSDQKTGKVVILYQEPALDFFSHRSVLGAGGALKRPVAIASGDFDGDGDVDLAVAEAAGDDRGVRVFFRGSGPSECSEVQAGYSSCVLHDPSGDEPHAIAAARITQDSSFDIVTAGTGFFAIYSLNFTAGGLGLRYLRVDAPGTDLRSVAVADLDNNGRLELVAADRMGHAVRVASQAEGGGASFSLSAPLASAALSGPLGIVEGDIDQNGVIDFAIADPGDPASLLGGNVSVFLGSTHGEYSADTLERASKAEGVNESPRAVALADFDGDELLDVASANDGSREVVIYRQASPGVARRAAEVLAQAQRIPAPASLAAFDWNSDLRTDLVAAHRETDTLTLFEQGGAGVFAALSLPLPPVQTTGPEQRRGPVAAAVGDLDGDGRADIVSANVDSNDLLVLTQDARGDFLAGEVKAEGFLGPESVALADIDGDGKLDIVAAARFSDEARWFQQGAGGAFVEGSKLHSTGESGTPKMIGPVFAVAGDLDADGRVDIVTANHRSTNLLVFLQSETRGSFLEPVELSLGSTNRPVALVLEDLDANGTTDLASANLGVTAVSIFLQSKSGVLEPSILPAVKGSQPTSIAARDLNGDAKRDLAVSFSSQRGSVVKIYTQAEGAFAEERSINLSASQMVAPVAVLAADLDGDGEADVATANRQSRNITVFFGGR